MMRFLFLIFLIFLPCTFSLHVINGHDYSPPEDCTDEIGISKKSVIPTSQIDIIPNPGNIDDIRLMEGNPAWTVQYRDNFMITINLREKYIITGIKYRGGSLSKTDSVVFEVGMGDGVVRIAEYEYYVDKDNKNVVIPMDPEKGIQVHYFKPIIETSYFVIFIRNDIPYKGIFWIFFQFELLGCKPEITTTTPRVPTTEETRCNDVLQTIQNINTIQGVCDTGKYVEIDIDPFGLYEIERIIIISNDTDLQACERFEVRCVMTLEEDTFDFRENCNHVRPHKFVPEEVRPYYCDQILVCFLDSWSNADEKYNELSIKVIGCGNVSNIAT